MATLDNTIYLTGNKTVDMLSSTQSISADTGYDGFVTITAKFISMNDVQVYAGDYTNDEVTITSGSKDAYYRRIYGE